MGSFKNGKYDGLGKEIFNDDNFNGKGHFIWKKNGNNRICKK